jgi:hypothetical protein
MVENAISIIFEHFGKSDHRLNIALIRHCTPGFQGFLNLGTTFPLPEFFQEIFEKVNGGQILVQLQYSLKPWSFLGKQMVKVFQEQVFASLDHLFSFLGGFLVFLPSYPINDCSKSLHQMELVKDHHRFGTTHCDRFDIRIPGIDGDCLNRVFLFLTQRIKEGFQGFTFSLLSDKNDLASFPVEHDGEVVMAFLHRHFIHCQKARIFIHLLRILVLKILFMNGFHCLPIQVKMRSDLGDGQIRTQGENILSQSFGDSFPRFNKVQCFDHNATIGTPDSLISNPQNCLGFNTIDISHRPFMIGMNFFHFVLTMGTHWVISFIRVNCYGDHLFFLIKGLFGNLDSKKTKKELSFIWDIALPFLGWFCYFKYCIQKSK